MNFPLIVAKITLEILRAMLANCRLNRRNVKDSKNKTKKRNLKEDEGTNK